MTASAQTRAPMAQSAAPSAMAPFRHKAFTLLWIATVASNVGTWMHDVGAGWLMTELAPSPIMVAAVQAATTLPIFLFALLAGAVADIVDRRRLLIWINLGMGAAALLMAALVHLGLVTPWLLLIFTFIFGTGAAFIAPAWQAIVPRLVPRPELQSAIALNSMGINISRAIGPALAGFLIVAAGLAAPFVVNAISVTGIVAALWWWRPAKDEVAAKLPPEHVGGAIVAGLRYAANSPALKAVLIRAAAFFIFASAFWAMLPLIAREVLQGGPTLYGVMLAAVGAGAVGGALVLPKIKAALGADRLVAAGTIGTSIVMLAMASVNSQVVAVLASGLAGLSWIAILSSLNVAAQTSLPDWVRARGLSIFLTVFFGMMSLGSLAWGQVASVWGVPTAMIIAAIGIVVMIPLTWRAQLGLGATQDLAPSMHWPEPVLSDAPSTDGPVMVQVVYRVAEAQQAEFSQLIAELAKSRGRSGAFSWSCMRDAADSERFVESWREASWTNHQRHHQRVTKEDALLQARIADLLTEGTSAEVTHLLTPDSKPIG